MSDFYDEPNDEGPLCKMCGKPMEVLATDMIREDGLEDMQYHGFVCTTPQCGSMDPADEMECPWRHSDEHQVAKVQIASPPAETESDLIWNADLFYCFDCKEMFHIGKECEDEETPDKIDALIIGVLAKMGLSETRREDFAYKTLADTIVGINRLSRWNSQKISSSVQHLFKTRPEKFFHRDPVCTHSVHEPCASCKVIRVGLALYEIHEILEREDPDWECECENPKCECEKSD